MNTTQLEVEKSDKEPESTLSSRSTFLSWDGCALEENAVASSELNGDGSARTGKWIRFFSFTPSLTEWCFYLQREATLNRARSLSRLRSRNRNAFFIDSGLFRCFDSRSWAHRSSVSAFLSRHWSFSDVFSRSRIEIGVSLWRFRRRSMDPTFRRYRL